jgi:RimJ/RimL family protein N-acetyltransferase
MRFPEKKIQLSDVTECTLRSAGPEDAAAMTDYLRQTAGETEFMLRCPDEVRITEEEEEAFLAAALAAPDRVLLGAWRDGELLGNLGLYPVAEGHRKLAHRAEAGIAVKKPYWGLGLGRALMLEAIGLAPQLGFSRLELEVYASNVRARRLYERLGFEATGRIPEAFRLASGRFDDAVLMSRAV